MKVSAEQLRQLWGCDRRTITNWLNESPPCPSTLEEGKRVFETGAVLEWQVARAVRRAQVAAPVQALSLNDARIRKALADAEYRETELAQLKGGLVPVDLHEEMLQEVTGRLRAVATGGLSRFAGEVQRAESPVDAVLVLEKIGDAILQACQGEAEELEADAEQLQALLARTPEDEEAALQAAADVVDAPTAPDPAPAPRGRGKKRRGSRRPS
jgi:phage terminase Nu1 subunit (DNA packaging protein)